MPWVSIAVWLISFFVSKSKGMSTGKAALVATGAGLASYYLVDPANKDNVFGVHFGDDGSANALSGANAVEKTVPGATGETTGSGKIVSTLGGLATSAISETGSTLRSWGPTGTLGVIAGTTTLSQVTGSKWFWPVVIGIGALLLLK